MTNREWGGLRAITEEAKQIRREDNERPLIDCPVCGETLDKNQRGQLSCPMGHFRAEAGATQESY